MQVPRVRHTATPLADERFILVAGGIDNSTQSRTATAEIYDSVTQTFSSAPAMTTARRSHTATLLKDGRVLVTGGRGPSGTTATAELYDPTARIWIPTGAMNVPRIWHTATLLANGQVLVVGGRGLSASTSAEVYDAKTGTWTLTGPLPSAHTEHAATLLQDGRVLVTGGLDASFNSTGASDVYDASSEGWTATAAMHVERDLHTASLLRTGEVLVTGGNHTTSSSSESTATVERYNPRTQSWTLVSPMHEERGAGHTATTMPDGRVTVVGGAHFQFSEVAFQFSESSSSEAYDPVKDEWMGRARLAIPRYGHAATLLRDASVFVNGGWTATEPDPTGSAERYARGRDHVTS